MRKWFVIGATAWLVWGSAAGAQQMKGLAPGQIASVARTRALDLRISEQAGVIRSHGLTSGMILSREVAPNALLGLGIPSIYGRKKGAADARIGGGPRYSRKPSLKFVMRF
ncbi:MAG TPA: hypothetical protein VH392_11145 [Sphingomicrobium sp.]|jgi:hypothetical protein